MAYRLALPPHLLAIHSIFNVSMLKRYCPDNSHVIWWDSIVLDLDLSFGNEPIAILNRNTRKLRSKSINKVKVHWRNCLIEEATWQIKIDMCHRYPQIFTS